MKLIETVGLRMPPPIVRHTLKSAYRASLEDEKKRPRRGAEAQLNDYTGSLPESKDRSSKVHVVCGTTIFRIGESQQNKTLRKEKGIEKEDKWKSGEVDGRSESKNHMERPINNSYLLPSSASGADSWNTLPQDVVKSRPVSVQEPWDPQPRQENPNVKIRIPPRAPASDIQGYTDYEDEWQANKTVHQANNYMLKYEVACDVTFIVSDSKEEIRAHKYMLMARSPVLFKLLVKQLGNLDVRIEVPDMKPDCVRDMLQYIYTDEFDIHSDNEVTMLFAAKKFQLKGLTNLCFQYLDAGMRDETVSKIMEQAHIYNETVLYEKCLRYTLTNGNVVLRKAGFSDLCSECVSIIIKSDDLRASEEAVFEGCMIWANAECRRQNKQPTDEARRDVLGKLLYLIRFPVMNVTYFTQKVSLGNLLSHGEALSIFQYFHGEEQQLPTRFSRNKRKRFPRSLLEITHSH